MALAFYALLVLLSWEPISLVIPASALSYVVGTLGAKYILGEQVSTARWAGVVLIALGACLSSYSEALKQQKLPETPPQHSTSLGPQ